VVAIEPVSEFRSRLQENLRINSITNVIVVPTALGDQEGTAPLFEADAPYSDGTIHDGLATLFSSGVRRQPREIVQIQQLDNVLAFHGIAIEGPG